MTLGQKKCFVLFFCNMENPNKLFGEPNIYNSLHLLLKEVEKSLESLKVYNYLTIIFVIINIKAT